MKALIFILVMVLSVPTLSAKGRFEDIDWKTGDSVLVIDESGKTVYQWRADKKMIPASVIKVLTAQLALDKWGAEHRFYTDVYFNQADLWIKGYGDPFMVSEEINVLSMNIAQLAVEKGVKEVERLLIDSRFFDVERLPGRDEKRDPYNAPASAIAANFNSVSIRKTQKRVVSGEKQTPVTSVTRKLAKGLGNNFTRVHVESASNAQQHFAEIMKAKLANYGLKVKKILINQSVPDALPVSYRHYNSKTLEQVLGPMLHHSNNFVANQLFLLLAQGSQREKIRVFDAQITAKIMLNKYYDWSSVKIEEGAGLSHQNRFSAKQIEQVLARFEGHKTLLRSYKLKGRRLKNAQVYAKTGTLKKVHTFAGYLRLPSKKVGKQNYRFVLLFNRPVPWGYRYTVTQLLAEYLQRKVK